MASFSKGEISKEIDRLKVPKILCDDLKEENFVRGSAPESKKISHNYRLITKDSSNDVETKEPKQFYNTRALSEDATTYELEKFENKVLLIFNQKHIEEIPVPRYGTEKDVAALTKTFENIGFKVIPYEDQTLIEIFEILNTFCKTNFTDYGCIAIAVLTHGTKGKLCARDGEYEEKIIWKYLDVDKNRTLVTKPRILILQACRGSEDIQGVPVQWKNTRKVDKDHVEEGELVVSKEPEYFVSREADTLTFHSSSYGKIAFREHAEGSWFIQSLCKKIDELSPTWDLESIFIEVKREVALKMHEQMNDKTTRLEFLKQTPVHTSALTRKLYFRKYGEDNLSNINGMSDSTAPIGAIFETNSQHLESVCKSLHFLFGQRSCNFDDTDQEVNCLKLIKWISCTETYLQSAENSKNDILRINCEMQKFGHVLHCIKTIPLGQITRDFKGILARSYAIADQVQFMMKLQNLEELLGKEENKFSVLQMLGTDDVGIVKQQLSLLDSYMENAETLNRQMQEHAKYTSSRQGSAAEQYLTKMKSRLSALLEDEAERRQALERSLWEREKQQRELRLLLTWVQNASTILDEATSDLRIRQVRILELAKLKDIVDGKRESQTSVDNLNRTGAHGTGETAKNLADLNRMWSALSKKIGDRKTELNNAMKETARLISINDEILIQYEWVTEQNQKLAIDEPVHGNLDNISRLIHHFKKLNEDVESHKHEMHNLSEKTKQLDMPPNEAERIYQNISKLMKEMNLVQVLCNGKLDKLSDALQKVEKLHNDAESLIRWLFEAETKLNFPGQLLPLRINETLHQIQEHNKFTRKLMEKRRDMNDTILLAHSILRNSEPNAVREINKLITDITNQWDNVWESATLRSSQLAEHLKHLKGLDSILKTVYSATAGASSVERLLQWISNLEKKLSLTINAPLPMTVTCLNLKIKEHNELMKDMQNRQIEIDRVCQHYGRAPTTLISSDNLTVIQSDRQRADQLFMKSRSMWQQATDRKSQLNIHLSSVLKWDDWKERFLKFIDYKKSRVTKLFPNMNKDICGVISCHEFINSIIASELDTSREELTAVVHQLDKNNTGFINWEEFISSIIPYSVEKPRLLADSDIIHTRMKFLLTQCKCQPKFRVFDVGEGKYMFGDSQYLVCKLGSNVLVQVNGGKETLDDFFEKTDPCRGGATSPPTPRASTLPPAARSNIHSQYERFSSVPMASRSPLIPPLLPRFQPPPFEPMYDINEEAASSSTPIDSRPLPRAASMQTIPIPIPKPRSNEILEFYRSDLPREGKRQTSSVNSWATIVTPSPYRWNSTPQKRSPRPATWAL